MLLSNLPHLVIVFLRYIGHLLLDVIVFDNGFNYNDDMPIGRPTISAMMWAKSSWRAASSLSRGSLPIADKMEVAH